MSAPAILVAGFPLLLILGLSAPTQHAVSAGILSSSATQPLALMAPQLNQIPAHQRAASLPGSQLSCPTLRLRGGVDDPGFDKDVFKKMMDHNALKVFDESEEQDINDIESSDEGDRNASRTVNVALKVSERGVIWTNKVEDGEEAKDHEETGEDGERVQVYNMPIKTKMGEDEGEDFEDDDLVEEKILNPGDFEMDVKSGSAPPHREEFFQGHRRDRSRSFMDKTETEAPEPPPTGEEPMGSGSNFGADAFSLTGLDKDLIIALKDKDEERISQTLTDGASVVLLHHEFVDQAKHGNITSMEFFRRLGADPEATDKLGSGWQAVHWAAVSNRADVINYLHDCRTYMSGRSRYGITALHLAASHGHLEACQSLIDCGADPEITNEGGLNALQLAKHFKNEEVVSFLQSLQNPEM